VYFGQLKYNAISGLALSPRKLENIAELVIKTGKIECFMVENSKNTVDLEAFRPKKQL
jgi:hypothetical protein